MLQMEATETVIHIWYNTNTIPWSQFIGDWKFDNSIAKVSNIETEKFTNNILKMEI